MNNTNTWPRQRTAPPPARGILLVTYGILALTLLLGTFRSDIILVSTLLPIAVVIGLGQYATG